LCYRQVLVVWHGHSEQTAFTSRLHQSQHGAARLEPEQRDLQAGDVQPRLIVIAFQMNNGHYCINETKPNTTRSISLLAFIFCPQVYWAQRAGKELNLKNLASWYINTFLINRKRCQHNNHLSLFFQEFFHFIFKFIIIIWRVECAFVCVCVTYTSLVSRWIWPLSTQKQMQTHDLNQQTAAATFDDVTLPNS
jgi:hypothetical protein